MNVDITDAKMRNEILKAKKEDKLSVRESYLYAAGEAAARLMVVYERLYVAASRRFWIMFVLCVVLAVLHFTR